MQLREGLSDRHAAEAVWARIDWKDRLALYLTDPGFEHSFLFDLAGLITGKERATVAAQRKDDASASTLARTFASSRQTIRRTNDATVSALIGQHFNDDIRRLSNLEKEAQTID